MRPLLQHASRSLFATLVPVAPQRAGNATTGKVTNISHKLSICWSCQFHSSSALSYETSVARWSRRKSPAKSVRRQLSSSRRLFEEKKPTEAIQPPSETTAPSQPEYAGSPPAGLGGSPNSRSTTVEDTIPRVPAEDLPSHRESQRWNLSKRFSELMDELLPKLAVVTQKVNTYTGTDYSGIEALRQEIKNQEQLVKKRHAAIDVAKQAVDEAHTKRAASQKEVVALLERKHSWSATDLERYMTLIRSEHVNDQAVREAQDALLAAETALEEARSQLEKRERAQYHEEQIWSDTIRRNSTWVTFGLMGFNIFLLLASLVLIEPWRRKRMVNEIKTVMESRKPALEAAAMPQPVAAIEVEPMGQPMEGAADEETTSTPATVVEPTSSVPEFKDVRRAENATSYTAANVATEPSVPPTSEQIEALAAINIDEEVNKETTWLQRITVRVQDLKSEEHVSIRKRDLSAAMLTSAAAGWMFASIMFLLISRSN